MNYDEAIKALKDFEWLSDKLAYWSHHDISELDDEYNYSELLNKIYFALETAKKEHELLELYKERHYQYVTDFMRNGQLSAFENSQWDILDRKITELECELK